MPITLEAKITYIIIHIACGTILKYLCFCYASLQMNKEKNHVQKGDKSQFPVTIRKS